MSAPRFINWLRLRIWRPRRGVVASESAPRSNYWGPIDCRNEPPKGLKWKLTYCTPDGEELVPHPEELRKVIYEQPPEYYYNSGAASLYGTARDSRGYLAYSIHNTPSLCWFMEKPFGFHFIYDSAQGARQLTYDDSGPQPRVKHYLGGNPIYLPRGCFVSKDLAWEVVQEFLRTQQTSAVVKWISSGEFEALGIDDSRPN